MLHILIVYNLFNKMTPVDCKVPPEVRYEMLTAVVLNKAIKENTILECIRQTKSLILFWQ